MNSDRIVGALSSKLPQDLAQDIVESFLVIRRDVITNTLGRAAPGKFVESLVQILQFLETGTYEKSPRIDSYLSSLESRNTTLDDGLRICAARVGRGMYTLRNKRNIAHKGLVDPNKFDLHYLHSAAQWLLAELIRVVVGGSMEESGKLIAQIQAPLGGILEDFGEYKVVLQDLSTQEEMLVLLRSYYPDIATSVQIKASMSRRSQETVRKALRRLWKDKLLEGDAKSGYKLTQRGLGEAIAISERYAGVDK